MIRHATEKDLPSILSIYNEGIEDRMATLETDQKDAVYINQWFQSHKGRYVVLVSEGMGGINGYASIQPYSPRAAYAGVGELSVYVRRGARGQGIGGQLLKNLEEAAANKQFHKLVLFTFPFNTLGQGLYRKRGYREVGIFKEQGILDGTYVDVMIMEKILTTNQKERES
ncbi:L-amino acid N-acyltransferase YncA [Rossellomorea marisflavi]